MNWKGSARKRSWPICISRLNLCGGNKERAKNTEGTVRFRTQIWHRNSRRQSTKAEDSTSTSWVPSGIVGSSLNTEAHVTMNRSYMPPYSMAS